MKKEAEDLEQRLQDEPSYIQDVNLERKKRLDDQKIEYYDLKQSCRSLENFAEQIRKLEEHGFVEVEGDNIDEALVYLPERYWEGVIQDALDKGGVEDSVYSSALGTMIAFSLKDRTILTLKILCMVLNKNSEDGEVSVEEFERMYASRGKESRKATLFRRRDGTKDEEIRAIVSDDGEILQFNREMVRANERWRDRTNERVMQRRT